MDGTDKAREHLVAKKIIHSAKLEIGHTVAQTWRGSRKN